MKLSKAHAELKLANLQDKLLASIEDHMGGLHVAQLLQDLDAKVEHYIRQTTSDCTEDTTQPLEPEPAKTSPPSVSYSLAHSSQDLQE